MKSIITCFLIYLCLTGCTPQRRLNRLVARHPELITVDTVRFRKVYPLPAKRTLMPVPAEKFHRDLNEKHSITVTDTATHITVSITAGGGGDTLFMSVDVPEDTLRVDEPVPVKTVNVTQQTFGRTILENLPIVMPAAAVFIPVMFGRRK